MLVRSQAPWPVDLFVYLIILSYHFETHENLDLQLITAQVKQNSGPGKYLDLRETGLLWKFDAIYRRFSTREAPKNISGPSPRHHYQFSD